MIRALVLIMVAGVLANAQCYGSCAIVDSQPAQPSSSDSCHHQKSKQPTGGVCQHQHTSVAGPENGPELSKLQAEAGASFVAVLVAQQHLSVSDLSTNAAISPPASPPGIQTSPGSTILRI